jgi:alanine racemase
MPGRLSAETTRHILEVARRLGYTPNPIARSLNTRRTNALGVIVPQDIPTVLSNPFFAELMSGIGEVCDAEGMSLMVVPPMRGSLVDATYAALVDGCIVTGLGPEDKAVRALRLRQIPFVMIDVDAPVGITSIRIDDCDGGYMSMKHVLDHGHRQIAIVSFESFTGKVEDYMGTLKHRFDGFRKALREHGLALNSPDIHVLECACNIEGGRDAFQRLMSYTPRPTAIVALSDIIAYGFIEAAHDASVHIPEDFSVVGFDDIGSSRLIQPPLTTVHQPIREKGKRAAEMFIGILRDRGPAEPEHVMLPVTLVERSSVMKIG